MDRALVNCLIWEVFARIEQNEDNCLQLILVNYYYVYLL